MRVTMLQDTVDTELGRLTTGQVVEVPDEKGERWERLGIAEKASQSAKLTEAAPIAGHDDVPEPRRVPGALRTPAPPATREPEPEPEPTAPVTGSGLRR